MQFQHDMARHTVTRVTGPHHNYLAITFASPGESPQPRVVELPPQGGCEHPPLHGDAVLSSVLLGVEEGNRESGAEFTVATVEFVANDTGPVDVYRFMAKSLVTDTFRYQSALRARLQ